MEKDLSISNYDKRAYFADYFTCVIENIDGKLLTDDMYADIKPSLEDHLWDLFMLNIRCEKAVLIIESELKNFYD